MRAIVNGLEKTYNGKLAVIRVNYADPRMREVVAEYGADAHPALVFIRPDGTMDNLIIGETDRATVVKAIERVMQPGS